MTQKDFGETMNSNIKIVNYDKSLAKKVATMWNESSDGWLGEDMQKTAEVVQKDYEQSAYTAVYIAVEDDKAVGFLSLSPMNEDKDALYIGLLNVRPEYHGKKIGKALVKQAVLKTLELGYNRLYLHTWSGNTKAVPLYKKCGFFWEEDNTSVKLLNFVPGVVSSKLLSPYFEKIDWYANNVRKIEVKPDGVKQNKFDVCTYKWQNNEEFVDVDFTLKGRGIKAVKTKDFSIDTKIIIRDLVFKKYYEIEYTFENKTPKPMQVEITGIDDGCISFNFEGKFILENSKTVKAKFFVNEIEKEINSHLVHPSVKSVISINGKPCEFATGIVPKIPIVFDLVSKSNLLNEGQTGNMMLNITNNIDEDIEAKFALPDYEGLKFDKQNFAIELKAKQKKSIELDYLFEKACWLNAKFEVKVNTKSESLSFNYSLDNVFMGCLTSVSGFSKKSFYASNLSKVLNIATDSWHYANFGDWNSAFKRYFSVNAPSFGKPFTKEFQQRKPDDIICQQQGAFTLVKAIYRPSNKKGIEAVINYKFSATGILEKWIEVKSEKDFNEELIINDYFNFSSTHLVIPQHGKFIETDITEQKTWSFNKWDTKGLTENWIYSKYPENTGICWEEGTNINLNSWNLSILHEFENLKAGKTYKSKKLTVCVGTFETWKLFRNFALKTFSTKAKTDEALTININNGNPFVNDEIELNIKQNKHLNLEDTIAIENKNQKVFEHTFDGKIKTFNQIINLKRNNWYEKLQFTCKNKSVKEFKERTIFYATNKKIDKRRAEESGKSVLLASNGILSIKASADYAPGIFDLNFNGKSFVDTAFPEKIAKSWWKPWVGGLYFKPSQINFGAILKESFTADFVEMKDNFNNNWQGIEIKVDIKENDVFKGLSYSNYYLMQAESNVLCAFVKANNKTGKARNLNFVNYCFYKASTEVNNNFAKTVLADGSKITLMPGGKESFAETFEPFAISAKNLGLSMHIFGNNANIEAEVENNLEAGLFTQHYSEFSKTNTGFCTKPVFYIFTDDEKQFCKKELKFLENIKFD